MTSKKNRKKSGEDESLYTSANSSVIELNSSVDDSVLILDDSVIPLDNASIENTFLAGGDTNMNPTHSFKTPGRGADSMSLIAHEMVTSTPGPGAGKRKRDDSLDRDDAFVPDKAEVLQDEGPGSEGTEGPRGGDADADGDGDSTLVPPPDAGGAEGEIDEELGVRLPPTVTPLRTAEGGRVYLVGTAHFSLESQEDVAKMIQLVKPHIVCVELCKTRTNILALDEKTILEEAKNINFEKIRATIRQMGVVNGLMYVLLLNVSAHITSQVGMAPGGEFRRAVQEAMRLQGTCLVHLIDRPLNVTIVRALRACSWWQTLRLSWRLLTSTEPISKEDIERCKQRDLLEELLKEMAGEFPELGSVFVHERDVFLTHSLQLAAASTQLDKQHPEEATRVVAVVGMGHVAGITALWGRVSSADIPPLMVIPPPSRASVLLGLALKAALLGAGVWAVARFAPRPDLSRFLRSR